MIWIEGVQKSSKIGEISASGRPDAGVLATGRHQVKIMGALTGFGRPDAGVLASGRREQIGRAHV